jgi:hypothetical protein
VVSLIAFPSTEDSEISTSQIFTPSATNAAEFGSRSHRFHSNFSCIMFSTLKKRDKPAVGNRFRSIARAVKTQIYSGDGILGDEIIAADLAKYLLHHHSSKPVPWTNDWSVLRYFLSLFDDWAIPTPCQDFLKKVYHSPRNLQCSARQGSSATRFFSSPRFALVLFGSYFAGNHHR